MYTHSPVPDAKSQAVSHNFCLGCGMCALNCPQAAIVMEEQGIGTLAHGQIRRSPALRPHLCVHCGRCAAVCPSGTIQQYHLEEVLHRVCQAKFSAVAFVCSARHLGQLSAWERGCISPQMSLMDARRKKSQEDFVAPPHILLEEVRCTGRLGPRFLLRLVLTGVRHVAFFPCGGDGDGLCQYAAGGAGIEEHVRALQDMLQQYGVGEAVRFEVHAGATDEEMAEKIAGMV